MKIGEMLSKIGATIPPVKPTLYQQLIEAAARVAAKLSPFQIGTPARRGPRIERPKGAPMWSFAYTRCKGKVARPAWTYRGARRNALFQRGIQCP